VSDFGVSTITLPEPTMGREPGIVKVLLPFPISFDVEDLVSPLKTSYGVGPEAVSSSQFIKPLIAKKTMDKDVNWRMFIWASYIKIVII
jgi:hypothetical protein